MKISSKWNEAPPAVKWPSLLWLALGLAGIVSGLYSLLMFLQSPVSGMTKIVAIQVGLQVGLAALIVLASWKLLARAAWSRVVLEVASWMTLAYYAVFGITWIGSAVFNWEEFKAEIATEFPQIDPGLKMVASASLAVVLIVVSAILIKALRSSAARNYLRTKKGQVLY